MLRSGSLLVLLAMLAQPAIWGEEIKLTGGRQAQGRYLLVGWNDLGMHCVDGNDYSVFSILPPFNNVRANLMAPDGTLVKVGDGVMVTYQAMATPAGYIHTTSADKTNFWQFAKGLFGVDLLPDVGLAGNAMPGTANIPQAMTWEAASNQFVAIGVPILPYPDNPDVAGAKNFYPMMQLTAWDSTGTAVATAKVVLPVSDEMACGSCHASGVGLTQAMPKNGWANDSNPGRDYKLNILALHDDLNGTVLAANQPVLCAACHASNALGTPGVDGVVPLTQALHARHANVFDPQLGMTLNDGQNRDACYRCHPGSVTKCLRGAMGNAGMQCQNCHGTMSTVGTAGRKGWLDEPGCQSCHTGTAMNYNGAIRQTDAFEQPGGAWRTPADTRFAVNDTKLFRQSTGHGGLACENCHGSTHAEYPSSHENDNLQIIERQGHTGMLSECSACHGTLAATDVGPHGLHQIGQVWVSGHTNVAERSGTAVCRDCHGSNYRGTVLSVALTDRSFTTRYGLRVFPKGTAIGCYSCHNGPNP